MTPAWFGEHLASTVISMADYYTVSKQFYLVSIAAQSTYPGGAMGATVNTTLGAGGLKVMVNAPKAGDPAFLWDIGESKIIAGGTITAGGLIMSDATGKAIAYVDNGVNVPVGEARMAAVSGDIFTAFMFPTYPANVPSAADALTAVGTNQATALVLVTNYSRFTTVASGTGGALPAAFAGMELIVVNAGANTLAIYGNGLDTIDGTAGATGVTLTTAHRIARFTCFANAKWVSDLGGAVAT